MICVHSCAYRIFTYTSINIGVLAMMWPCGVISSLSELYNAESKNQVYGQLHDFLRNLPDVASNLSKDVYHVYKKLKIAA